MGNLGENFKSTGAVVYFSKVQINILCIALKPYVPTKKQG